MNLQMGKEELTMGGKYLTELRTSNSLMGDFQALRQRMEEDGYLFIKGFHDREKVLQVRSEIVEKIEEMGHLQPNTDREDAIANEENNNVSINYKEYPSLIEVVNSEKVMSFFNQFLGGEAITYDYKWARAIPKGGFTGAHYDIVYMGRGTKDLYTCWTPLTDVSLEMGPLAVCVGSHRFKQLKETYGNMDVDRDNISKTGWFSSNPIEIVDKHGGKWASASVEAGDVIIFGMFTMHGSLNNTTNRYRISADTRYQLNTEPIDERWIGENPKGHYAWNKEIEPVPMETAREKWGV